MNEQNLFFEEGKIMEPSSKARFEMIRQNIKLNNIKKCCEIVNEMFNYPQGTMEKYYIENNNVTTSSESVSVLEKNKKKHYTQADHIESALEEKEN